MGAREREKERKREREKERQLHFFPVKIHFFSFSLIRNLWCCDIWPLHFLHACLLSFSHLTECFWKLVLLVQKISTYDKCSFRAQLQQIITNFWCSLTIDQSLSCIRSPVSLVSCVSCVSSCLKKPILPCAIGCAKLGQSLWNIKHIHLFVILPISFA